MTEISSLKFQTYCVSACAYFFLLKYSLCLYVNFILFSVLDVAAFERLLGPCMNIMRRNVDHYQKQVVELFGSEANISDLR